MPPPCKSETKFLRQAAVAQRAKKNAGLISQAGVKHDSSLRADFTNRAWYAPRLPAP